MNLQKQVSIIAIAVGGSTPPQSEELKKLSLFEAVRSWVDDERVPFDIVDEGNRLTAEQIQEIAHSDAYKEQLLAFDERR